MSDDDMYGKILHMALEKQINMIIHRIIIEETYKRSGKQCNLWNYSGYTLQQNYYFFYNNSKPSVCSDKRFFVRSLFHTFFFMILGCFFAAS